MIKVRIGNDIRLNVTLKGVLQFDLANIKQLKCYLINTLTDDKHTPFFKTKPTFDRLSDPDTKVLNIDGTWYSVSEIDPDVIDCAKKFCPWHEPDQYRIDICGPACYHYWPWNDVYDHCHTHWHFFDRRVRHNKQVLPHFDQWETDLNVAQLGKEPYYLAPCRITSGKNNILVYFPAEQLYFCGTYKLVIKIVAYEAGWGPKNLRERTIEYPDIFTIVDNTTGTDDSVVIKVTENGTSISNDPVVPDNPDPVCDCEPIPIKDPGTLDKNGVNPIDSLDEILT